MYKGAKINARLLICEDCDGGNCGGHFQPRSLGKTPDRTSHGASGAGRGRGIVFGRRNVALWAWSCRSHCAVSQFPSSCCCGGFKKMPLSVPPPTTVRTASLDSDGSATGTLFRGLLFASRLQTRSKENSRKPGLLKSHSTKGLF